MSKQEIERVREEGRGLRKDGRRVREGKWKGGQGAQEEESAIICAVG